MGEFREARGSAPDFPVEEVVELGFTRVGGAARLEAFMAGQP